MTIQAKNPTAGEEIAKSFADLNAIYGGKVEDLHAIYRDHRLNDPVMEGDIVAQFGVTSFAGANPSRKNYTLFKYADVMNALRDSRNYSSAFLQETGLGAFLDGMMLTAIDGDEHRRLRGLLAPAFTAGVMDEWRETMIRPMLQREFVAPLTAQGKAELITEMGVMFPIRVVYTVLGFPDDPERMEWFAVAALKILAGPSPDPEKKKAAFQAAKDLYEPTLEVVKARRAEGATGSDLISRLINAEFEGQSLNDHQITNFVRMMLPAASETTSRTFSTLMHLLLERPELIERLRADRSLIRKALDESMRYEPVATFKVRQTEQDVTLQGVDVPKGSILSLCVASANRDETVFEDADTFDIDRVQKPQFGFGFGAHMCLGLWLAKAEIEVAVDLLLDAAPRLRLDPAYPKPEVHGVQMRGPNGLHVILD